MNKFFKKSWIAILALATTIVAACSSSKNSNGNNPQNNNQNVSSDDNTVKGDTLAETRAEVQRKLDKLREVIRDREMSCVYGSPEIIHEYGQETMRMRQEADSLQNLLDNGYGANNGKKKSELKKRLNEINRIIEEREMEDVYGSPEIIEKYAAETNSLRIEAAEIRKQIDSIEGKTPKKSRKELKNRIKQIESTLKEREKACVYGSPEVMERYRSRNNELRREMDSLQKELDALDDTEPEVME